MSIRAQYGVVPYAECKRSMIVRNVSPKTRFEIFKRDAFTCQYCGRKAPDVVLEADHIDPVSNGGTDDPFNLITSCEQCNAGKGKRVLSDHSIIEKQRRQLELLEERRQQIEMMLQWKHELAAMNERVSRELETTWNSQAQPYTLTKEGLSRLNGLLRRHELGTVIDAIHTAQAKYLHFGEKGATEQSAQRAFDMIFRICSINTAMKKKPYLQELFYIRGILRNRFQYVNRREALTLLEAAFVSRISLLRLKQAACQARNWTQWVCVMNSLIEGQRQLAAI